MREIKFRALFKDILKQEYKWFYSTVAEKPTIPINYGQHTEWDQFTGLKDNEDVDIYERDICSYGNVKFTIVFKNGAFGYIFFGDFHWLVNFNKSDLKVIGNIHENKDLLEERD